VMTKALILLCLWTLSIYGAVFNVMDYGAKGDGKTLDTKAITSAIAAVASASGGTVYFPKGQYLTSPFNFTSNMELNLDASATILAVQDMTMYNIVPAWPSYGVGRDVGPDNYEPVIAGYNLKNVSITGGVIDGQGVYWWDLFRAKKLQHSRPVLVQFQWCDGVTVTKTILRNSPFWTLHPLYSNDIYIGDITILAPVNSPNTDGIDIDSSTNALIERVSISNGDDMIAIKSGMNMPGILFGKPTENVIIRDSVFADGHGLSIGSETSGSVRNITFMNLRVTNADTGPKVKTSRGRGGVIENILFTNITLTGCKSVTLATGMNYDKIPNPGNATTTPIVRNVTFEKIIATSCLQTGSLECLPESHCTGFILQDINIEQATKPFVCQYITGESKNVYPPSCVNPAEILI